MEQRQYFVYDGQEVIKTGRIASREHQVSGWNGSKMVLESVCEITPIVRPGEYAWKKWVKESELFVINDVSASDPLTDLPVDDLPEPSDPSYNPLDDILDTLRGRKKDGPDS